MNDEDKILRSIIITMRERWDAMKPNVYRNRKKYTRKKKHKNGDQE